MEAQRQHQAVLPDLHLGRYVAGDGLGRGQQRDLHGYAAQLLLLQIREPGIVAGGRRGLRQGLAQRERRVWVPYASPELPVWMGQQGDERPPQILERVANVDSGRAADLALNA